MRTIGEFSLKEIDELSYFDYFASIGGATLHPGGPLTTIEVLHHVALSPDELLLEVGCGTGATTLLLLKSGFNIRSCDINPRMVAATENRCQKEGYLFFHPDLASSEQLPYEDNTFRVVLLEAVFGFIKDFERAFRELKRVLKPNGYLAFVDMHYKSTPPSGVVEELGKIFGNPLPVLYEADWFTIFQKLRKIHWNTYDYPRGNYGKINDHLLQEKLKSEIPDEEKREEVFRALLNKFGVYESALNRNRQYLKYHVGIWQLINKDEVQ
jgi:ubiquinone/menaquinone biosynthesis C-methylase UbiE